MWVEALGRAVEGRKALGLPSADTDAYRLVHGAGDGIPWLTLDAYADYLVASTYRELSAVEEEQLLDALHGLGYAGVYLKRRPRTAHQLSESERAQRTPKHALRGEDAPESLVVRESGMPIEVRLGDGLSTGIFLDQRHNRAELRAVSNGKRVLNLFAYTCAFGVAAALGGAAQTVNIDVSKPVLERGKLNYRQAGIDPDAHLFLARDALEALPRLARRGEVFDIVVLDPPSFASTRKGRFSVERDYGRLVAEGLALLSKGGRLLACTNHQRTSEARFSGLIGEALVGAAGGLAVQLVPPPPDHPADPEEGPHLKSAWIRPR